MLFCCCCCGCIFWGMCCCCAGEKLFGTLKCMLPGFKWNTNDQNVYALLKKKNVVCPSRMLFKYVSHKFISIIIYLGWDSSWTKENFQTSNTIKLYLVEFDLYRENAIISWIWQLSFVYTFSGGAVVWAPSPAPRIAGLEMKLKSVKNLAQNLNFILSNY